MQKLDGIKEWEQIQAQLDLVGNYLFQSILLRQHAKVADNLLGWKRQNLLILNQCFWYGKDTGVPDPGQTHRLPFGELNEFLPLAFR